MKKVLAGFSLLLSISSLASSYTSCYCKGEQFSKRVGNSSYAFDSEQTKTSVYGIYTNKVTGKIEEKKISEISLLHGSNIDHEKCDVNIEKLIQRNVCPSL